MLGLGIGKLLLTLAVIVVAWYGARWWARLQAHERAKLEREQRAATAARRAATTDGRGAQPAVEETVRCTVCGAYVPARGSRSCGRGDCPFP